VRACFSVSRLGRNSETLHNFAVAALLVCLIHSSIVAGDISLPEILAGGIFFWLQNVLTETKNGARISSFWEN